MGDEPQQDGAVAHGEDGDASPVFGQAGDGKQQEEGGAENLEQEQEESFANVAGEEVRDFSGITSGMVVRVYERIADPTPKEPDRTRAQIFEGTVIARKHGKEAGATITVRKVVRGNIAVEKIFPLFSPVIEKIEVLKQYKTRRAKLYFLRKFKQKMRETKVIKQAV